MSAIKDLGASIPALQRQFEDFVSRFMASDQGQRVIAWYEHLGQRDRIALRVLGGFAVLVLIYAIALQPMIDYAERAQRRLQDERDLVAWLRANESSARQASAGAAVNRDQPVATVVNTSAKENKLTIRRYEPAGEGSIRIWLEGAGFNSLVKWLYELQSEHGIRAVDFTVEREAEPGTVSARLTLEG